MEQNLKVCQSCGMPMQEEQYGTNQDGSGKGLPFSSKESYSPGRKNDTKLYHLSA